MNYFIQVEQACTLQHVLAAFRLVVPKSVPMKSMFDQLLFDEIVRAGERYQNDAQPEWWDAEKQALSQLLQLIDRSDTVYVSPLVLPARLPTKYFSLLTGFAVKELKSDSGPFSALLLLWLKAIQAKCGNPFPAMVEAVGLGEGAAVLRLAEEQERKSAKAGATYHVQTGETNHAREHVDESMVLVQANIDDASPEWLSFAMERLFQAGANDVNLIPITMKKSRQATMIQVLCYQSSLDMIKQILFTETTTFGLRYFPVTCHRLARRFHKVHTPWGEITVKIGYLANERVHVSPEYEECAELARKHGIPVRVVYQEAIELAKSEVPIRL